MGIEKDPTFTGAQNLKSNLPYEFLIDALFFSHSNFKNCEHEFSISKEGHKNPPFVYLLSCVYSSVRSVSIPR